MRNKSLIHTKDIKTQEGTPLHLEYYLLNDSVLGGCAECYGVEDPRADRRGAVLRRYPAHHHARHPHLHAHRSAGLLRRYAGFAERRPPGLAVEKSRQGLSFLLQS